MFLFSEACVTKLEVAVEHFKNDGRTACSLDSRLD